VLNVLLACMTVMYSAMAMNKLPACSDANYWVIVICVPPINDYRQCSLRISPLRLTLNHFNTVPHRLA